MALTKLIFDKYLIPRKEFSALFAVSEGDDFYLAAQPVSEGSHLRSAPFARSSLLIKGPKYNRSMKIAREALAVLKGFPRVRVYTAYSPKDPSYFVSGFETTINSSEDIALAEEKILLLKAAWEKTLAQMKQENIEVWSK